jgi:cytochrome P450
MSAVSSTYSNVRSWAGGWVSYGCDVAVAAAKGLSRLARGATIESDLNSGAELRRRIATAERGEMPAIEQIGKICSKGMRKAYVVHDLDIGKEVLKQLPRNGKQVQSTLYDKIKPSLMRSRNPLHQVGTDNMLTCPHARHGRLRSPLNAMFGEKRILEARGEYIVCTASGWTHNIDEFVNYVAAVAVRSDAEAALSKEMRNAGEGRQLSNAEAIDTLHMLGLAGTETTKGFLGFFRDAVVSESTHRRALMNEWRQFLLEKLPGHEREISELVDGYPSSKSELGEFYKRERLKQLLGPDPTDNYGVLFNGRPVLEFVQGSPYLEACYQEAVRLYPTFSMVSRTVSQDCQVRLGQDKEPLRFKAGDEIHVSIITAQRDGRKVPNAGSFMPERHLDQTPDSLTFSAGQGICLGRHLAKLEAKIFIFLHLMLSAGPPELGRPYRLSHNGVALTAEPPPEHWISRMTTLPKEWVSRFAILPPDTGLPRRS